MLIVNPLRARRKRNATTVRQLTDYPGSEEDLRIRAGSDYRKALSKTRAGRRRSTGRTIAIGVAAAFAGLLIYDYARGRSAQAAAPDPVPPTQPVPLVRLNVAIDNGTALEIAGIPEGIDVVVANEGRQIGITTDTLPVDVLVSVPNALSPIEIMELGAGVDVAAGNVGFDRDLIFRVTRRSAKASIDVVANATHLRIFVQ